MRLKIQDSNQLVDVSFGTWLIHQIQIKLIANIDAKNLVRWDKYLTESDKISRLYNKQYSAADLIILAVKNLVCTGVDGDITIKVNPNLLAPGYDRIKLVDLVRLINYGNTEVKGYSLFSNTFREVSESIESYLQLYYKI